MAWLYAKNGRIEGHLRMVRRSYSLAFAAVTLRFYIFLFSMLVHGVGFVHNYLIIAFVSWVPNLLFAEFLNSYYRNKVN